MASRPRRVAPLRIVANEESVGMLDLDSYMPSVIHASVFLFSNTNHVELIDRLNWGFLINMRAMTTTSRAKNLRLAVHAVE